jgi:hypothetical protein
VVRVVEGSRKVTGELVDPISEQRRRFTERASLIDAVCEWIDGALEEALRDEKKS